MIPGRTRTIPNGILKEAAKAWRDAASGADKAARHLHYNRLHRRHSPIGIFGVDFIAAAATAPLRGAYNPFKTCPVCAVAHLSPQDRQMFVLVLLEQKEKGWPIFSDPDMLGRQPLLTPLEGEASQGFKSASPWPATVTWTHIGNRFIAGYTVDDPCYGIWDRENPGLPIERFPYTEHGKSEVVERFRQLEPEGVDARSTGPPPPPSA